MKKIYLHFTIWFLGYLLPAIFCGEWLQTLVDKSDVSGGLLLFSLILYSVGGFYSLLYCIEVKVKSNNVLVKTHNRLFFEVIQLMLNSSLNINPNVEGVDKSEEDILTRRKFNECATFLNTHQDKFPIK